MSILDQCIPSSEGLWVEQYILAFDSHVATRIKTTGNKYMTNNSSSNDYSPDAGGTISDLQPSEDDDQKEDQKFEFGVFILILTVCATLLANQIQFLTDFAELLNPNSSSGRLMFAFTRRTLRAFSLECSYREAYVLNEAFLRGLRQIREGYIILNPQAWLRSTSYNIIRELKREQQKLVPFQDYMLEGKELDVPSADLEDDLATLRLALQMLDPSDQRLLNLKIVEGLSWKQIRDVLRQEGFGDHDEAKLRKRKERALIRLRKKFHALKPALNQENHPF